VQRDREGLAKTQDPRTLSCLWWLGPDGGGEVLTQKEVAEQTETYAVGRLVVNRNDVLDHIMEEAGFTINRAFRTEKRKLQASRQTITVTMNHLAGWKAVGAKASPRWERVQ
jgi:hypothetical protein